MAAIKKLYDAANAALDVIDDEVSKGFPEPDGRISYETLSQK